MKDDPNEDLEKRTRDLENQFSALRAGVMTLAACSVAFLGIEYLRIPSVVHGAIRERIDEKVLNDITNAKAIADALINSSKENHTWDDNEKKGFVIVGPTLICFGTHSTTTPPAAVWTRKFDFSFAHPFASPPSVNLIPITKGSGYTFGIYNAFTATKDGCSGMLNEAARDWTDNHGNLNAAKAEVSVSFVAIGPAPLSAPTTQATAARVP